MSLKIAEATLTTPQSGDSCPLQRDGDDTPYRFDPSASSGGLPLQLPVVDGRYYGSLMAAGYAFNAISLADEGGKLFAVPFACGETKTWTRIGFQCDNTIDTGNARVGVYSAGADGLPSALLGGGAELTVSADREPVEETVSVQLLANTLYWPVFFGSPATAAGIHTFGRVAGNEWIAQFLFGMPSGWDVTETGLYPLCVYKAQAYGALPATFGAIDGYEERFAPHIWLRTGV